MNCPCPEVLFHPPPKNANNSAPPVAQWGHKNGGGPGSLLPLGRAHNGTEAVPRVHLWASPMKWASKGFHFEYRPLKVEGKKNNIPVLTNNCGVQKNGEVLGTRKCPRVEVDRMVIKYSSYGTLWFFINGCSLCQYIYYILLFGKQISSHIHT